MLVCSEIARANAKKVICRETFYERDKAERKQNVWIKRLFGPDTKQKMQFCESHLLRGKKKAWHIPTCRISYSPPLLIPRGSHTAKSTMQSRSSSLPANNDTAVSTLSSRANILFPRDLNARPAGGRRGWEGTGDSSSEAPKKKKGGTRRRRFPPSPQSSSSSSSFLPFPRLWQ